MSRTTRSRIWATTCSTCRFSIAWASRPRPADAVAEVRAARPLGQRASGRAWRRPRIASSCCFARRASGIGSSQIVSSTRLMEGYGIVFGVLIALLIGLAAGKAWERYKLVEGRWIDRRRVRAVAALHPRTELPRRQPGRSGHRRAREGGAHRSGRARAAARARQPLSREGTDRAARSRSTRRCFSARGSTASSMRTCCSAWDSTTGGAGSSTGRSRRSRRC